MQRDDEDEERWKYTVYLVNFPGVVGHSDTEKTTFHVSEILYHLVPEARILPHPIFGGNTAAHHQVANPVQEENQPQAQQDQNVGDESSQLVSGDATGGDEEANATERLSLEVAQTDWDAASIASTVTESFSPISIEREALELLDTIRHNSLTDKSADLSRIILAGYGFGGIVVKQAIIIANTTPKYYRIALNISKLIFFATPHRRNEKRGWEQILLDMIKASETKFYAELSEVLHEFVSSVPRISYLFHKYAAKYPIANFTEQYGVTTDESIVGQLGRLNNGGEDVVLWSDKHFSNIMLCDIEKLDQLESLRNHFALANLWNHCLSGQLDQLTESETTETYFETLQTLSSSHWLPYERRSMDNLEDFITLKEIYGPLLEGIASEKVRETGSIQVVGPPGHGKSALLKFIAHRISQKSPVVIIENILVSKSRKPTLYAVYLSFVHQIISQRPSLFYAVRNMTAEMLGRRTWTLESLRILLAALLQHSQGSEFIIIIYDYDEWPDEIQSWWSDILRPVLSSSNSKFTFLTSSHSNVENLSSEPHRLNLEKKHTKYWNKFIQAKLNTLLDRGYGSVKLRQGQTADLKSMIKTEAKAFKGSFTAIDNYLTSLFETFSLTTLEAIEGHIEASPKTEQAFYELEIAALQAKHKHIDVFFWISSAISWMMWSARPLRIEELAAATAVTLEDSDVDEIHGRVSMDMERDLRRHLSSTVAIENGQARIASSRARVIFATPLVKKQLDLQDDYKLTLLCLHYLELVFKDMEIQTEKDYLNLSGGRVDAKDMDVEIRGDVSPTKQKASSKWTKYQAQISWKYQTLETRTEALGFLDYACRFWPTHFLRIKRPDKKLRDAVVDFLSAPGIGESWFKLYLLSHGEPPDLVVQYQESSKETTTAPTQGSIGTEHADILEYTNRPDSSLADTTALDRQLAVRMACHVGLVAIIPDLLESHKLVGKPGMIDVRRGYSERSVAILDTDISYELDCAISNDDAALVKELLDSGRLGSSKFFPLHKAALGGSLETVRMLCNQPENVIERDGEGRIPLHLAAAGGSVEIILLLLANSPPDVSNMIDMQDTHLKTPLITASAMGHIAATKLLVQCGVNCKIEDGTGRTALHYAVLTCSAAVQDLSFRELAHIRDNHGCTPLHIAAMSGNVEITSTIVAALDDCGRFDIVINHRDNKSKTPLQYAAESGYKNIVEEFLRHENDIDKDNYEKAAELAAARGHLATVSLFMSSTNDTIGSQLLVEASKAGQLLVVQYLLGAKHTSPDGEYLGSRPLCQASAEGHMEVARALLRHGASINVTDGKRKTPLHHAAENGRHTIAETLLSRRANVSAPDIDRRTPLHSAASAGKAGVITLLIKRGANIEACSRTMETPLHLSIGNPTVVKVLLDSGADANATDTLSQTPLHLAARSRSLESAQHLLKHGADVDAKDDYGRLALYYAIEEDDLPMVELLCKDRKDLASPGKEIEWAIGCAAVVVFRYLLDPVLEAKKDLDDDLGRLLHTAASGKSAEITTLLLKSGANANFKPYGLTPLHVATKSGRVEIIRVLLDNEAKVDVTDTDERTPLHLAASYNLAEAVEMLLKAGANINAQDEEQRTPVYIAAYSAQIESLEKLLKWNPDLKLTNSRGWSPFHVGVDNLKVTKLLIGAGGDPNLPKDDQWTPLHLCTSWEHENVVKYLLENGGDPKLATDSNKTALYLAVDVHSTRMVSAMLEHGAAECINTPDKWGETPFHLAIQCSQCPVEMIQLLIDHGANLKKQSSYNTSNLVLAIDSGNVPGLKTLLHIPAKVPSELTWQHEELVAAYWRAIDLGITRGTKLADIVEVLVKKHPNLIDEVTPGEGLTGLEMCLSKRGKWKNEELIAIRLVKVGANPFVRSQPDRPSALELGVVSRRTPKVDFLKLCEEVDDEEITAAKIGFKELRIAAELEQADLWSKLDRLQPWKTLRTDMDHDGWTLDHFIHQAAGRMPAKVESPPPTSFQTPKRMVFHEFWASSDNDMESRFKIEDDGLTVSFSADYGTGEAGIVCLRADHPFPPRPFPPDDAKGIYFEVKIFETETQTDPDSKDSDLLPPVVAIGLCGEFSDQSEANVGWNTWTVGYHGDNGGIYDHNGYRSYDTGRTFGPGDTVGCGVDYSAEEYFFTLGGEVTARQKGNVIFRKLYPTVSQQGASRKIKVNFEGGNFLWQRTKTGLRRTFTRSRLH